MYFFAIYYGMKTNLDVVKQGIFNFSFTCISIITVGQLVMQSQNDSLCYYYTVL